MIQDVRLIKRRTWLLSLLVLLQLLVLAGIAVSYYAVGWFGTEIKLKTAPVDPRDYLYGDYVRLGYDISRLDSSLWNEKEIEVDSGKRVYVLLKPDVHGVYEAKGIYASKPAPQPGEAVLRGTVTNHWSGSISISYGLEKYYVPEGTGRELEEQANNLIAKVKVASWGQAKIVALEPRG
ncbi:GDYXXLXY domain-containing protein [Paenibacillus sp. UNC451MF]|uniref:GDYXXLXY domain-containing protein n=1 Tax=Paenibacillus sp. UNC451MF TaxID=1449063 RepID=UPI00048C4EF9|nr:GDYXXLXY domain-containing protein [Paenibacillus sp. UNC451MF]